MGTKPKFWCLDSSGAEFLFKESRWHSGEHWSEKIAAEIAGLLGLPHAEIELAICAGKKGTLSRNFLTAADRSNLIHGNELLYEHDLNYPVDAPNFRLAQHTLNRILSALRSSGAGLPDGFVAPDGVLRTASDLFVGYVLLDALIANTDRHHANWAVIVSSNAEGTNSAVLAPTFDHASSLGRELTDERRRSKLSAEYVRNNPTRPARRDQTVVGYLESGPGRSRIYASEQDTRPLHPLEVSEQTQVKLPEAAEAWIERLQGIEMTQFEAIVAQVPTKTMSQLARDFALCLLDLNRTALITRTFQYA